MKMRRVWPLSVITRDMSVPKRLLVFLFSGNVMLFHKIEDAEDCLV